MTRCAPASCGTNGSQEASGAAAFWISSRAGGPGLPSCATRMSPSPIRTNRSPASAPPGGLHVLLRPGAPAPLPVPVAPVAGEALASFLGRLAAANRTTPEAVLDILPPWFRVKARWHNDRWLPSSLMPWADDAAARLAVISGSTAAAIKNALPAFGGSRGQPVRAVTACRLCTAARRISQPVPVHLPAHHQVCLRHGIWLSGAGTPQFSVRGCPDIMAAERQARRLRCTVEQLIYSKIQATAGQDDRAWKRRTLALIETNPWQAAESSAQALFQAAAYPEAVAAAAGVALFVRSGRAGR
jgi:hypothetical protein